MKKLQRSLLCILGFSVSATTLFASTKTNPQNKIDKTYSFGIRVTGKGKPMILIPGMKGAADTYNEIVDHYKNRYKCYVITLAGFAGQPASVEVDHPLQKQRDDIIHFIEENKLHKPVLVGFSFGGSLALWIATTRPDLIGPLIELDGTPFDTGIDYPRVDVDSLKKAQQWRHDKIVSRPAAYWLRVDSMRKTPAFRKEGFVELQKLVTDSTRINQIEDWDEKSDYKASFLMDAEQTALDLRDRMSKITSPILVLGSWKGWDVVKTKEEAEQRYREQYAPAKNVTIAFSVNGKHFLMYEDFDWMITQMDAFLNKP